MRSPRNLTRGLGRSPGVISSNMVDKAAAHEQGVERLRASYRAIPDSHPVRLAKKTSNLFRNRAKASYGLDVSGLSSVISVDPVECTATVGGMCTYEDLVAATLSYGLLPLVVPQLKTITIGGAVTGLGVESSSFRNGLPHESVHELDVFLPNGTVVTATKDNEYQDLFRGFPNSYGTLGYCTKLVIALERVESHVKLRHIRCFSVQEAQDLLQTLLRERQYQGEAFEYLDGVVFSPTEVYLSLGSWTSSPAWVSDYTKDHIYYRSLQHASGVRTDYVTIADYIWRWDTDWFWCSRAFGAQHPVIRRLWPKKYLRSSFYWKLVALDHKYNFGSVIQRWKKQPQLERVVQDIEVSATTLSDFLSWFLAEIPIQPLWLCPLRLSSDQEWALYPLQHNHDYVNVGFWSAVPLNPNIDGYTNRQIEERVSALGGHKSLYSEAFYDEETFWQLYGGVEYSRLKHTYDRDGRLLDLYAKAVQKK